MTTDEGLRYIDSDGHILEPPTDLPDYAPAEYRDRIWHIETDEAGEEWLVYNTTRMPANSLSAAGVAGASDEDRARLTEWRDRGRTGLNRRFDPESGLCADYDVRTGEDIRQRTFAGFAPLFARTADPGQRDAQLRRLDSADFCGDPRLRWPLLPSTSAAEPAFQSRNYWRGPVWPVITWLLWQSLSQLGCIGRAEALRRDSLTQIAAPDAGEGGESAAFGEYFEPFTGEPLGSAQQSWTAAVILDWLAAG